MTRPHWSKSRAGEVGVTATVPLERGTTMPTQKLLVVGFLSIWILVTIALVPTHAADSQLTAGAAKVDITPPESALHPSDSIRDHLFARAIVIRQAGVCAVLVGLDQGAARNDMVQDALSRSSSAVDCPQSNFIISATHTHSGSTAGLGGGGDPSAKVVADAIVKAVN